MNDLSLILEFVQEAREYIEEVEPTLIKIFNDSDELGAVDSELINSVFRLFHSMKGSASFLSLTTVTSVTHEAETLLDKIRNGKISLSNQITATLCKVLDLFRDMLEHIAETGNDEGFDDQAAVLITILKKHVAGESVEDAAPSPPVATPPPAAPVETPEPVTPPAAPEPTADASSPPPAPERSQEVNVDQHIVEMRLSPEMLHSFVQEASEQLDAAEQALLLVLDESVDSKEPLKDSFRCIHSFKGNCGFMGLADVEHLSHSMETLLDALRNETIHHDEANISKLLGLLDVLRHAVEDISAGRTGQIPDLNVHIQELNTLMGQQSGTAPATPATPAVPVTPAPATPAPSSPKVETPHTAAPPVAAAQAPAPAAAPAAPVLAKTEGTPSFDQIKAGAAAPPAPAAAAAAAGGGASTSAANAASKVKQDIRVDLHKLDLLINLVGELVIAESMVTRCPAVSHVEDEYYNRAKHQLRRICDDLKDTAMSVRMIPLSATFRKMIRLVHDLSTKSGKKIKLNLVGEETEVDKTVIEQIADPLVHIVRNSCDHGVETPEERAKTTKPEVGTVTLEGRHEGGEVWIRIIDDGRGLNREKIFAKGIEKGLIGNDARDWPDEKIFKLVFEPGFSTADKVTDISGRGVGMDVVKRNIEKLNGRIDILSKLGEGSTFTLRIPLTLAIVDAMLVRVGTGRYMIPTLTIRESLVPTKNIVTILPNGKEVLRLREEMVPIIRLYDVFGRDPGATKLKDGILIVAEDSGKSFAFFVDEIIGQQQTVIKGLPDYIGSTNGFSGCTILGDGTVSLILDVGTVSQMATSYIASPVDKDDCWDDNKPAGEATVSSMDDLEAVAGTSGQG